MEAKLPLLPPKMPIVAPVVNNSHYFMGIVVWNGKDIDKVTQERIEVILGDTNAQLAKTRKCLKALVILMNKEKALQADVDMSLKVLQEMEALNQSVENILQEAVEFKKIKGFI